jgi:hypothetical protein
LRDEDIETSPAEANYGCVVLVKPITDLAIQNRCHHQKIG